MEFVGNTLSIIAYVFFLLGSLIMQIFGTNPLAFLRTVELRGNTAEYSVVQLPENHWVFVYSLSADHTYMAVVSCDKEYVQPYEEEACAISIVDATGRTQKTFPIRLASSNYENLYAASDNSMYLLAAPTSYHFDENLTPTTIPFIEQRMAKPVIQRLSSFQTPLTKIGYDSSSSYFFAEEGKEKGVKIANSLELPLNIRQKIELVPQSYSHNSIEETKYNSAFSRSGTKVSSECLETQLFSGGCSQMKATLTKKNGMKASFKGSFGYSTSYNQVFATGEDVISLFHIDIGQQLYIFP